MEFSESILIALISVIGGTFGTAIVNAINERWKIRQRRKAEKEDKREEKLDKTEEISADFEEFKKEENAIHQECEKKFVDMQEQNAAMAEALKVILLDRIRDLGQKYIMNNEITFEDRRVLHMMHKVYHDGLNGNGDADLIMAEVNELPLKT